MRNLSDLTLDELVTCLIAGDEVKIANDDVFQIADEGSQRALAFYNRDRNAFWNPDKDTNILEGEIDRLLDALDKPIKAAAVAERPSLGIAKWKLTKIAAHRFRGLHRHCADNGGDPNTFEFDVSADGTLLRGFNGAGKTSLVSAICWCLTSYGYRSQALPAPLHQTIEVRVPPKSEDAEGTAFEIPSIVPVPNEEELVWVDGKPKDDTWVKLTFVSLIDGQEVTVERHLKRQGKKGFIAEPVGFEKLGLSDLALQIGSLMPGIAASTRFDDKTTLSQAISTLTGFRPLAQFGKRSARVYDRLSNKYPDDAEKAKKEAIALLAAQQETLQDLLKVATGLPTIDCLTAPSDDNPTAWHQGLEEAENRLKAFEDTAAAEATIILGKLPSLATEADVSRLYQNLETTRTLFSNAALKSLPSIQDAQLLAAITQEHATEIESICTNIEEEAQALAQQLAHAARSDRLRLYALVARWHNAAHPGEPIDHCPVCANDLATAANTPHDTLLGKSVKDALEASREAGDKATVTAEEWERLTAHELRNRLPESAHPFIDKTLPDTLPALYKKALTTEVFGQREFPTTFKNLSTSISKVCDTAWASAPDALPLRSFSLPQAIPDKADLRSSVANVLKALRLSRYRSANGAFAKTAMSEVLEADPQPPVLPINERSVAAQLALVERYLESARHLAGVRRQLAQIKETCDKWSKAHVRLGKLERAAAAVLPFTRFPDLVHDQVEGLFQDLQSQAGYWADKMYRAAFVQAPGFAGFDGSKRDGLSILASHGKHLVDAQHIMNASALRIYLIAFVFALWQQMWGRTGGLATVLLDDPQDLLDPGNVANLAATVPHLLDAGMRPLIVSNDFGFIPSIEDFVKAHPGSASQKRTGVWEFSAISRSKSTASLAPVVDEVRERRKAWRDDPNNVALARAFVHPVRVRIEMKLWDLLACDPAILKDPTLNDLLGKISGARTRGEKPFNEEPFRKLLEMPSLHSGAAFRAAINKAHHGKADAVTPTEAEIVEQHFDEVFAAIDSCWLAFARFMGRLPPDNAAPANTATAPNVITFPGRSIPVLGRLAARERGAALATNENATETFSLSQLGPVALFALRAPTLGVVAFPGQTLITLADAEIRNGDIAVVQTARRTYARRIGVDRGDLSRIALETLPSSNPNVPPTHFIKRMDARICKVVGVLFDDIATPNSSDEAVPTARSPVTDQVTAIANVVGDSAFPVAVNGGRVLLGQASDDLNLLEGRIIAVMTRADEYSQDYFAYLKRLGKSMPGAPDVHYLENVGETGEGEYVRFASARPSKLEEAALVERYWKVHGSLF